MAGRSGHRVVIVHEQHVTHVQTVHGSSSPPPEPERREPDPPSGGGGGSGTGASGCASCAGCLLSFIVLVVCCGLFNSCSDYRGCGSSGGGGGLVFDD